MAKTTDELVRMPVFTTLRALREQLGDAAVDALLSQVREYGLEEYRCGLSDARKR